MNIHASNNSLNASGSLRQNLEADSIFELQKILTDEKRRAAEHKLNYQQIKSEMGKLQENYARLQDDLAECNEFRRNENEENHKKLNQANRKLLEADHLIEDLKMNQVTEKRIEMIRLKIEEQFESVYQERLARCNMECDSLRNEMGRIRTENSFLKSEYENQHQEHARIIEEMNLIHNSEVASLRTEKARLLAASVDIPQESSSVKEISKENSILRSQLKALSNELEEARSKSEHDKNRCEQDLRIAKKQLSDVSSQSRKMELELESLRKQLVVNEKELSNWNTDNASLQFNCNELDRTNRMLQNRLDELTQKAKVDLTQLKLESAKQKGDIERQNELLISRTDELEYQLRLAGNRCGQLERQLQEREVSIGRREASIKETEWAKMQQLENEKLELSNEVAHLQSMLREEKGLVSGKISNLEERAMKAEQMKLVAEKDADIARHKLESSLVDIKNLKTNLSEIKNKVVQQEAELDECYNRLAVAELLKKEKHDSQKQVKDLKKQLNEIESQHERTSTDKEAQWLENRQRHQQRIKELEEELSKSLGKTRLLQEELRRKNKKHCQYFNKQKRQLQIATALKDELGVENEILKRNVPAEDFQQLARELKDLRRRHQEYRAIIMQFGQGSPVGVTEAPLRESHSYEQSLEQLKRRLEMLDEKQQQQLPEVLQLHELEKGDPEKAESTFGPRGDIF